MNTHLTRYVFGAAVLMVLGVAVAQQKTPAPAPVKQAAKPGLAIDDVIKLVKAGVSEDLIVALVRKNGRPFNLTAQEVLQLKQASVSDNVIKIMLAPEAEVQPAMPGATTPVPEVLPPELPQAIPATVERPAEIPGTSAGLVPVGALTAVPDEVGVYWVKDRSELVRIEGKAVSNVRTGGMLAHSATLGIKRTRIDAQLRGPRAETRTRDKQPQFCLYLPESASVGDYLLVRLTQREDVRQVEIGQSRFMKAQAGVNQDVEIEYSQQRIKPRLHIVVPKAALAPGEYGFYPATGTDLKNATSRIYDFGIDP